MKNINQELNLRFKAWRENPLRLNYSKEQFLKLFKEAADEHN